MNLLFVDETANVGGAELNLLLQTQHLQKMKWPLQVVVPEDGPLTLLLRDASVPVHKVPRLPLFSTSFYIAHRVKVPNFLALLVNFFLGMVWVMRLARFFHGQKPTIVHTVSMNAHIFAGAAAWLVGCPLVWHFQDIVNPASGFGLYRLLVRFWGRVLPQRIICCSEKVQAQFANDHHLEQKCRILWYGIDVNRFSPAPATDQNLGAFLRIATVARLTHWKGQEVALRVAHLLKQRGIPFRWHFVGDESLGAAGFQAHLMDSVHQFGLTEQIHFEGWVMDMPAFYNTVDLLVHLPLEPEPFGLVIAEAMASGIPVIATAGGGLEGILEAAGGYLVPSAQPDAVVDILQQLSTQPEMRQARGKRAREVAIQTFDPQKFTQDLVAIYQSLAEDAQNG